MSTNKLSLHSPISALYAKPSTTVKSLNTAGINTIEDLFWLLPRKLIKLPPPQSFDHAELGEYFRGIGKILSIQARPNFRAKGKNRAMLYNINLVVQDHASSQVINLKWFNCYGSVQKKLASLDNIDFLGIISEYNDQLQISNPEYSTPEENEIEEGLRIIYPTIASINSTNIQKVINKIPEYLWLEMPENIPSHIKEKNDFLSRAESFIYLHGKINPKDWNEEVYQKARQRLIYEEFFLDQVKISMRKEERSKLHGVQIPLSLDDISYFEHFFPYQLTEDQALTLKDIYKDFISGQPMMRMVQGDVGCGKTTVAMIASFWAISKGLQVAFMCPTEALALQHFESIKQIMPEYVKLQLLLGSTSAKDKKTIQNSLETGEVNFVIGTHSLFQESVNFKNLGLAIIDEQHKFGVQQRIKLTNKGDGVHCLIMSATPIPRSLSLTQYGDLDLSIIKTMPSGRKGTQTRIVTPDKFEKFLGFVKTRVEMGEQVYIVVPAINESIDQNINDLNSTFEKYQHFYPQFRIAKLHGQLKADEKSKIFKEFGEHKIDILLATSVIEVGINVLNATIMAILNPERFGLSSLHQMRGRVGRGSKPGFCFLVTERELPEDSLKRLQVIEESNDGFKIAEEDLSIRGEGDLFGQEQSGVVSQKRIANIITDQKILYKVLKDYKDLDSNDQFILSLKDKITADEKILSTI